MSQVPERIFKQWVELYGETNARKLESLNREQRRTALAKFMAEARRLKKERDRADV